MGISSRMLYAQIDFADMHFYLVILIPIFIHIIHNAEPMLHHTNALYTFFLIIPTFIIFINTLSTFIITQFFLNGIFFLHTLNK